MFRPAQSCFSMPGIGVASVTCPVLTRPVTKFDKELETMGIHCLDAKAAVPPGYVEPPPQEHSFPTNMTPPELFFNPGSIPSCPDNSNFTPGVSVACLPGHTLVQGVNRSGCGTDAHPTAPGNPYVISYCVPDAKK